MCQSLSLFMVISLLPLLAFGQEPSKKEKKEEVALPKQALLLDESYLVGSLDENAPPLTLPQEPRPKKNPDVALILSLGSTTLAVGLGAELAGVGRNISAPPLSRQGLGAALQGVGVGLALSGLSLLPSAGHAYAGAWKRAALGTGVRAGAILLGSGLFAVGLSRQENDLIDAAAFGAAGLLSAAALVAAVIDVIDGEKAARRANQE